MRRSTALAVALLTLPLLYQTAPPAYAQEFNCPDLEGASLWEGQEGLGVVNEGSGLSPWTFICTYTKDGYDAGQAYVNWFEEETGRATCPLEENEETDIGGTIVSPDKAAYAYYRFNKEPPGDVSRGSLKGLAQALLSAASARAHDCALPPVESATPTLSASASPSPSATPSGTCTVTGVVIDHQNVPAAGVKVQLSGAGLLTEGVTDESGAFTFSNIGAGTSFDPAVDLATLSFFLEQPTRFAFVHKTEPAERRLAPFSVKSGEDCRKDLTSPGAYAVSIPPSDSEWADNWTMFRQLERAWTYAEFGLGATLDYGLPLDVVTSCDSASRSICNGTIKAFYEGTSTASGSSVAEPAIVVETAETTGKAARADDTIYHEFGHALLTDTYNNAYPSTPDRKAHKGYDVNTSSNDAWLEGFASFYASLVSKEYEDLPAQFRMTGGSSIGLENNIRPWGSPVNEEFAVASLLTDLEDGQADHLDANPPIVPATDIKYREIRTAAGFRVLVGKIAQLRKGQMALLFAEYFDGGGKRVRATPIWIDGSQEDLRSGRGVTFWSVIPKDLDYKTIKVTGIKENDLDDDPIDLTAAEIWDSIANGGTGDAKPGKPTEGWGFIFDVHELYQVLKFDFGDDDRDGDGVEDIDQLFIAHGLHEDPNGDHVYSPGEKIGLTSHPPLGADGKPSGPSTIRYDVAPLPEQLATIDAGSAGSPSMVAFVEYPEPNAALGYSYVASPDVDGNYAVLVPPQESRGRVTLLALADGYEPEVVAEIEAEDYWTEAAEHPEESFLSYRVAMRAGEISLEDKPSYPIWLIAGGALLIAVGAMLYIRTRRHPPGDVLDAST
jgi:hypothetical protein